MNPSYLAMSDELEKIAVPGLGKLYRSAKTGLIGGYKSLKASWKTDARKQTRSKAIALAKKKGAKVIRIEHVTKKPLISTLGAGMVGAGLGIGGLGLAGGALVRRQLDIHTGRRPPQPAPYVEA